MISAALSCCHPRPIHPSVRDQLSDNEKIVRTAITRNGCALRYAPIFQDNFDIVHAAVDCRGVAPEYASARLRDNPNIVRTAITENPFALQFIGEALQNDEAIILSALARNGESA